MSITNLYYLCIITICISSGIWIFKKLPQWSLIDRCLGTAIPTVTLLLLGAGLQEVFSTCFLHWNGIRLAPTFALAHGYQLYYGADSGPILNTIYGPITALAYLPTVFTSSPTIAIILASLISGIFFFIPILIL